MLPAKGNHRLSRIGNKYFPLAQLQSPLGWKSPPAQPHLPLSLSHTPVKVALVEGSGRLARANLQPLFKITQAGCSRPLLCAPVPEASRPQDEETTPLKRVFGSGDVIVVLLRGTTVFRPQSKFPPSCPGVFGAGSQLKGLGLHLPVRLIDCTCLLSKGSGAPAT